jgi:hypothetical protein
MRNDAVRRWLRLGTLCLAFSMRPWPIAAGQAGYSAVVMDVKGQATVFHEGSQKKIDLGCLLYPKDAVETAKGAALTITYLESGQEENWPGQAKFVVEKDGSRPAPDRIRQTGRIQLPQIASAQKGSITFKGLVEFVDLEVGSLSNTRTIEERPVFRWSPVPGVRTYRVRLYHLPDNQLLWQRTAQGRDLPYPPDAPALVPGGRYQWIVEALDGGSVGARKCSRFGLPPDEEGAKIKKAMGDYHVQLEADASDAATRLRYIFFLEEGQLFDDALAQYGVLEKLRGPSGSLQERRAKLIALRSMACDDY